MNASKRYLKVKAILWFALAFELVFALNFYIFVKITSYITSYILETNVHIHGSIPVLFLLNFGIFVFTLYILTVIDDLDRTNLDKTSEDYLEDILECKNIIKKLNILSIIFYWPLRGVVHVIFPLLSPKFAHKT